MVWLEHSNATVSGFVRHHPESAELKSVGFVRIGLELLVEIDETGLSGLALCGGEIEVATAFALEDWGERDLVFHSWFKLNFYILI